MVTINNDGYTDPIQETRGGTGQSSLTQGDILYASGANTLAKLAKDTGSTRVLTNTGASNNPSWAQVTLTSGVTGTLPETNGGTNQATYTQGDILYASAANTLAKLAKDAGSTRVLTNTGASNNPSWAQVALTTGVSGTLPEANGGTNQTTYTQGDLLYASAANTLAKLAKDAGSTRVLTNTGASNAPAWAQVSLTTGVSGVLPAANGGSAWTLISTQTASNSAFIAWTSGISSTYDIYVVTFHNALPITNGTNLQVLYSTNGGSSYATSGYTSGVFNDRNSTTYHSEYTTITTALNTTHANTWGTSTFSGGQMWFYNMNYTNSHAATFSSTVVDNANASGANVAIGCGALGNSAAVNAIKIIPASGNINTGTFSLWGVGK